MKKWMMLGISGLLLVVFTACSAPEYTVTFLEPNGQQTSEIFTEEDVLTYPTDFPNWDPETGYQFDGWFLDDTFTTPVEEDIIITGDMTVYAKFSLVEYEVTFNRPSGVYEVTIYHYGDEVVLPEPHIDGENFYEGLYDSEDYDTEITSFTMPANDVDLYMNYVELQDITLSMAYLPTRDSSSMLDAIAQFGTALEDILLQYGYRLTKFEQTVLNNYEDAPLLLEQGHIDLTFLTGMQYASVKDLEDDHVRSLFAGLRQVAMVDSDDPLDWNTGEPLEMDSDVFQPYYRSIILAGPSPDGAALIAKVNNGDTLVWDDIKDLNWCVRSATSTSGYLFPELWLQDHFGHGFEDITGHVIETTGYRNSMEQLAFQTCDIGTFYSGVRVFIESEWASYGRTESVWTEVQVVGVTRKIMTDVIAYNADNLDQELVAALKEALLELQSSEDISEWMGIYSISGFTEVNDEDFDSYLLLQQN